MTQAKLIPDDPVMISEREFEEVSQLLHRLTGISLNAGKRAMVSGRLTNRIKKKGLTSVSQYCALLRQDASDAARAEFVSAMTTNVTRFGREAHHFEHFENHVMPGLIKRLRAGERVRLWSAGCSSGEEPCDLAFRIADACPEVGNFDLRILATDIDESVLATARSGTYSIDTLKVLSSHHRSTYFRAYGSQQPKRFQVTDQVRDLISYRKLNLISEWPFRGKFDLILCRNVTIYFDAETQAMLWRRFADQLVTDGVLYIGHSESMTPDVSQAFVNEGVSIFRKLPAAPDANIKPQLPER